MGKDTTAATQTVTFKDGPGTHVLVVSTDLTAEPVSKFTHFVLAQGDKGQPLWTQYTDQKGTPDKFGDDQFFTKSTLNFGAFGKEPLVYKIAGSGRGAFYLDSLVVRLLRVPQPPPGYFYQGWLLNSKTGAAASTNTVTVDERGDGFDRVAARAVGGSFTAFDRYVLTLEAQLGDPAKPAPTKVQVSEEGKYEAALQPGGS